MLTIATPTEPIAHAVWEMPDAELRPSTEVDITEEDAEVRELIWAQGLAADVARRLVRAAVIEKGEPS